MENTSNSTKPIVINESDNETNKITYSNAEIGRAENNNSHNPISTTSTVSSSVADNIKPIDSEITTNETSEQEAENKSSSEEADTAVESEISTAPNGENVTNASTEVLLDVSISDRLADLSIAGNESPIATSNHLETSKTEGETSSKSTPHSLKKTEKSAELCRSILAGEVSDNSECSVEEDEGSDYVDDKVVSGDVSCEEMFIEDEDVEEEEEFHEVEEEKHRNSQEFDGEVKGASSLKTLAKSSLATEKVTSSSDSSVSVPVLVASDLIQDPSVNSDECVQQLDATEERLPESKSDSFSKTTMATDDNAREDDKTSDKSKSDESTHSKSPSANTDWANLMQSNEPDDTAGQTGENTVCEGTTGSNVEQKDAEKKEDAEKVDDVEKKELDLDEDVKNPQYIPKKGVFYEHDDRSHDVNNKKQSPSSSKKDDETVEIKESSNSKKTGMQEKQVDNRRGSRKQRTETDRWNHDLFRDEKQKPKSKSELINAYGYDIRQERASRNYTENRPTRSGNISTSDRQQGSQENQRSRPIRDNRTRQNQPINRSRERRSRRPNNRIRNDAPGTSSKPRDAPNARSMKPDLKEVKQDFTDGKQSFLNTPNQSATSSARRDYQDGTRDRVARNDNRGRRLNSKDRPTSNSTDDKLPPINTVMPPITTWSNKIEDMVKEEASKESPSRLQQQQSHPPNNAAKVRSNDFWPQNQLNKPSYHDRPLRAIDDSRQQQQPSQQQQQQQPHYNSRRYQDRDDSHKAAQYVNRTHYNERSNQHHHQEWRRTNNYNNYAKSNEYEPIKTQTFENSRLSQSNMNRNRDAREIINERRLQNQNFPPKVQPGLAGPEQQKPSIQQQRHLSHQQHQQHSQQHQHQQQQLPSQPQVQHQHQHQHIQQLVQQQHLQQLQHHQTLNLHQQTHQGPQQLRQPQPPSQQPEPSQQQQSQAPPPPPQQLQNQRQHQQQAPQHQPQAQQRQGIVASNVNEGIQESNRLNSNNPQNTSDLINSRPIIKTDAYTGPSVGAHSQQPQPLQQHSQNHRSLGGTMSQQGPGSAGSHIMPTHLGAGGTQAQYYSPSSSSRDPAAAAAAAAALASAYHGYMPGGHSVMDTNRYHMTPQQLSEHGYMASTGQANDVAAASVLLPQGMYSDAASAGGTVASSAYLAQAGTTLSPSTNIPVTGAGPPSLATVSYLQHSQYAPPPYSNPYSQPQHNQAPPQSSHAYPYWTYI